MTIQLFHCIRQFHCLILNLDAYRVLPVEIILTAKKSLLNKQSDLKITFLTKLQGAIQRLDLINKYENQNRLSTHT